MNGYNNNLNNKVKKTIFTIVAVVACLALIAAILSFAFKAGNKAKEGAEQQVKDLFESSKDIVNKQAP